MSDASVIGTHKDDRHEFEPVARKYRRHTRIFMLCLLSGILTGLLSRPLHYDRSPWFGAFFMLCIVADRFKRGMEAIVQQYPESVTAIHEFCRIATVAQDWNGAYLLFERIGNKMDKGVWKDPDFFLRTRELTIRVHNGVTGVQPGRVQPKSPKPAN